MSAALVKKLRLGPDQDALVINPPPGYLERLELPAGVSLLSEPRGKCQFVQLFVRHAADLELLRNKTLAALEADAIFWICYPKLSGKLPSDLTRDILWKLMGDSGLRPVTQISIDETWSAMRFRPHAMVK